MSYFRNLFISIDQLGNTLGAGNPDVTISARTGYFANKQMTKLRLWWKLMEMVIDFAFEPFDGPGHCLKSYDSDQECGHEEGNDLARAFIGITIIIICPVIAILARIWVLINPSVGYKEN